MDDNTPYKILALLIIIFAALHFLGKAVKSEEMKAEAIRRGFAEYNSTNGVWQWKER